MKIKYVSIFALAVVVLSGVPLISAGTANYVNATYSNSQAQSFDNGCGIDGSIGPNCQNIGPQNVGDGTATALAPLQISNGGEQGPPGPQGPKGDTGVIGPAGPDKELQVRQSESGTVTVPPLSVGEASAKCRSDEVLTGGGFGLFDDSHSNSINPNIVTTGQEEPEGVLSVYNVFAENTGPNPITIFANAECAKLVDVPLTETAE